MKLGVIGCINGCIDRLNKLLLSSNADLFLCMGDIGILKGSYYNNNTGYMEREIEYRSPVKPVIFTLASQDTGKLLHEFNKTHLNGLFKIKDNLYYLPVGKTCYYNGINIASLGGEFNSLSYYKDRLKLTPKQRASYTLNDFIDIVDRKDIDIVLTYESPYPFLKVNNCHIYNYGKKDITELIKKINPFYHFHRDSDTHKSQIINYSTSISIPDGCMFEYDLGVIE